VTRGLINALNDQEIEAVLGHELTHIRNGDVRMLVIAVVMAGVISFFGELVFRIFFQNMLWGGGRRSSSDDRKGGAGIAIVIAIVIIALVWILSVVIRFALSRQREYLADSGSVELTKNSDAMISALRKIEGRGEIPGANSAVMEMCIDNPREGFSNIFDTHPPVDKRVEALVKFAGGHDPGPLALPGVDDAPQIERNPPAGGAAGNGPWAGGAQQQTPAPPGPWSGTTPDTGAPGGGPWGPKR
jgi:heat shock protein HtpX